MNGSGPLPAGARVAAIHDVLEQAFAPTLLEVRDDSHRHIGHAGARDGRGHFDVVIASDAFIGQSPLARHRAVYAALGELMTTDIHALSIHAGTSADQGRRVQEREASGLPPQRSM